jgi:hypothetical protein
MPNQPCKTTVRDQDSGHRQMHQRSWTLPEHDGLMDQDPASPIPQHALIRYGMDMVAISSPLPFYDGNEVMIQ